VCKRSWDQRKQKQKTKSSENVKGNQEERQEEKKRKSLKGKCATSAEAGTNSQPTLAFQEQDQRGANVMLQRNERRKA